MEIEKVNGALSVMAFLIFIMLALWSINTFKHSRSGKWSKIQKITDIAGIILLVGAFAAMVIPMLKR